MTIILDGTTGINTPGLTNTGTETLVNLTTTGNTTLGDATTDTLTVGVTGIVKDASGNVGIGTASPVTKLFVIDTSKTSTTAFANVITSFRSNAAGADSTIQFSDNVVNAIQLGLIGGSSGSFGVSTGGAERMRIASTGQMSTTNGAGTVALAYDCRAWVNFNGVTTTSIRASGNITSVTRNSAGDYTVNFTNAMVDANYSSVISVGNSASATVIIIGSTAGTAPTTSAIRFSCNNGSSGAANDVTYASVAIFR